MNIGSLFLYDHDLDFSPLYGIMNRENGDYFVYGMKNSEYHGIICEKNIPIYHNSYNEYIFKNVYDRYKKYGWSDMTREEIRRKAMI
jgi:hypothetical protein